MDLYGLILKVENLSSDNFLAPLFYSTVFCKQPTFLHLFYSVFSICDLLHLGKIQNQLPENFLASIYSAIAALGVLWFRIFRCYKNYE